MLPLTVLTCVPRYSYTRRVLYEMTDNVLLHTHVIAVSYFVFSCICVCIFLVNNKHFQISYRLFFCGFFNGLL